jgi:large subunit ribosomal protein L24
MNKIKKGDEVKVIAGKDKGKIGKILEMCQDGEKVLVEGINQAKKHVKADPNSGNRGGIVEKPMPIHRSNVMLVCDGSNASRVGIRQLNDGKRVRYFKSNDQLVDVKE